MALPVICYLSMEVGRGRTPERMRIPTYSGGLGALSGCHLETIADLDCAEFPYNVVAVSLLYPEGYFRQVLGDGGWQHEEYPQWNPEEQGLQLQRQKVAIDLADRMVEIGAWRDEIRGRKRVVPVYSLDTSKMSGCDNTEYNSRITARLYAGDNYQRLVQEAVLGIGAVEMMEALGIDIALWHLNEGHAAFIVPALLKRLNYIKRVKERVVYTTHSPVAGHDRFDYGTVKQVFNGIMPNNIQDLAGYDYLDMTQLAFSGSRHANAVSRKHADTSRRMFGRDLDYVTNGVHTRWVSEPFQVLFDAELPGWRDDPSILKQIRKVRKEKLDSAMKATRADMVGYLNDHYNAGLDPNRPVISWARRFDGSDFDGSRWMSYKRPELVFWDMERLKTVLRACDAQLVFAGKAHPNNTCAKEEISRVNRHIGELRGTGINAIFVPDYDMERCRLLTAGSDLWLYTPKPPLEACSTSGMCAAINGRPQVGTRDGWWDEGFREGKNGWVVGGIEPDYEQDAKSLYSALEVALRADLTEMAYGAIETGSGFSAHRMIKQYAEHVYQ